MLDDIVEFEFEGKRIRAREILTGKIGCRGNLGEGEYMAGYVRQLRRNSNKVEDKQEFNDGEILVSQMTDPSMMEEIGKASAIVTEQGGLICHAASVARELKMFCMMNVEGLLEKTYNGQRIYLQYRSVNGDGVKKYEGVILADEIPS